MGQISPIDQLSYFWRLFCDCNLLRGDYCCKCITPYSVKASRCSVPMWPSLDRAWIPQPHHLLSVLKLQFQFFSIRLSASVAWLWDTSRSVSWPMGLLSLTQKTAWRCAGPIRTPRFSNPASVRSARSEYNISSFLLGSLMYAHVCECVCV